MYIGQFAFVLVALDNFSPEIRMDHSYWRYRDKDYENKFNKKVQKLFEALLSEIQENIIKVEEGKVMLLTWHFLFGGDSILLQ